jgi:hypothetical protein
MAMARHRAAHRIVGIGLSATLGWSAWTEPAAAHAFGADTICRFRADRNRRLDRPYEYEPGAGFLASASILEAARRMNSRRRNPTPR